MFAILGASGKIGYATSKALRETGAQVRAILRDAGKADRLSAIGCDIAYADLQDAAALARAIAGADAVQIIVPPQPQADDMAADLRRTFDSLANALEEARPALILAISDYGAHLGPHHGIPSLFHEFEERLRGLPGRKIFLRSAEHMENWGRSLPAVIATGVLTTALGPAERQFPTVSARDVGLVAADLLLHDDAESDVEIAHVEGPRRYSVADVASALGQLLGHPVTTNIMPRSDRPERLGRIMTPATLALMAELYDVHNKGLVDLEPNAGKVFQGKTELIDALRPLVSPR